MTVTTTGNQGPETSTDSHKQQTTTHKDLATTEHGARDTSTTVDTWEPTVQSTSESEVRLTTDGPITWEPTVQSTSESEVGLTTDGPITTTVDPYSFVTDAEDKHENIEASRFSSEESTDEPGNRAASWENQHCVF